MALLSCIASKLAQFSNHVTNSVYWRLLKAPHYASSCYLFFSLVSLKLKFIPISNKIHIVFPSGEYEKFLMDRSWNDYLKENETRIIEPHRHGVRHALSVLVKIIQALSDGLRLQHDCRVSANNYVPNGRDDHKRIKKNEIVVPSRLGKERSCFDKPQNFWGMKHNIEHLDGLNWELMVVESNVANASYHGNGRIVLHTSMLESFGSEEELAETLAHEVGHGVAMHMEGHPLRAMGYFTRIPWSVGFGPSIFLRLCDMILYSLRRMEAEADYIGLMLMASAGYDPRLAPNFYKEHEEDKYYLDTTHPSNKQRAKMLSQGKVMDKAVKIYKRVQAGHKVPLFEI